MPAIMPPIDIDREQVLGRIGYANDCQPSAHISSLVDDYIHNYSDLIDHDYFYIDRDILNIDGKNVDLGKGTILQSSVVSNLLGRCRKAVIFILTIGSYLEKQVASLAENGVVLQAAVLDAIGSSTVEGLAASFEEEMRQKASTEGMVISRRFSPGYCDWDISQQHILFRALGSNTAGVELRKSCLMIPQKSVSGIIGIGYELDGVAKYNPCNTCPKQDCPGRRK